MRDLPLCRRAVSVFCSSSPLGHRTLVRGGVSPLCKEGVCVFYSPCPLGHRILVVGVLPLCREAVGEFYSSSPLGYRTLIGGGSYPSAEKQSVYSAVPPDWVNHIKPKELNKGRHAVGPPDHPSIYLSIYLSQASKQLFPHLPIHWHNQRINKQTNHLTT